METQKNYGKIGIGTKENAKLKPSKVKIVGVEIQTKTKEGIVMKSPLAHILVKHPDREEHVKLSKIKIERNGKLDVVSLWVSLDDDGLFQKSSAITSLLNFLKCFNLDDIVGKDIETIEQSKEDTYLCLKAY